MSQLDYKIELLERRGSELEEVERNQLTSLLERRTLMVKLGIENKATFVPKFPPILRNKRKTGEILANISQEKESTGNLSDAGQVDAQDISIKELEIVSDGANNIKQVIHKSGQGVSSPYLLFVHQHRLELDEIDPEESLDLEALSNIWKKMDRHDKKEYYEKFASEKESIGVRYRKDIKANGLNEIEKQANRKETNKKYYKSIKENKLMKSEEDDEFTVKMKVILIAKENKLGDMMTYVESLKDEVEMTQRLNREVSLSVIEKDVETLVLKEQYKTLHKIHKSCV